MYPDPERFNPERWLSPKYPTYKEPLSQYPNLNGFSQFGFGRRTCQGVPIVEQNLFLTMGGMAWALNIQKKVGPDGREIPVHWNDYTPLLIAKPAEFKFDAVPRSKQKMEELKQMYEEAKEDEEGAGGNKEVNFELAREAAEEYERLVQMEEMSHHIPGRWC
jgi:hypothetical protein